MRGGVKVEGRERLNRKFKAMPEVIQARLRKVMERSANEIVRDMKRLAPVDLGNLRDSIGWVWGDSPEGSVVIARSAPMDGSGLRITIYAGLRGNNMYDKGFYAHFLEFGTRNASAQPFFLPAYRSNRQRAASRIKSGIRRAVKDIMAGKLTIGADE